MLTIFSCVQCIYSKGSTSTRKMKIIIKQIQLHVNVYPGDPCSSDMNILPLCYDFVII